MAKGKYHTTEANQITNRISVNYLIDAEMIEKAITHMHFMAEKIRVKAVYETIAKLLYDQGKHWFHHYFWDSYPEGITNSAKIAARQKFPAFYPSESKSI